MEELLKCYPSLISCKNDIEKAVNLIINSYKNGGKLLLCGNGGSCADCEHIVGELMKGFMLKRSISEKQKAEMKAKNPNLTDDTLSKLQLALPTVSLPSMIGLNTAFCNDIDPNLVFAQGVMGLGKPNDILICISTSGNSTNCVAAANIAKALDIKVVSLTGKIGGKLKGISDICVCAPEIETFKVQELHLPIYHFLCAAVENYFYKQ